MASIRAELLQVAKLHRVFTVELQDAAGTVHAVIGKTLHVRLAQ